MDIDYKNINNLYDYLYLYIIVMKSWNYI